MSRFLLPKIRWKALMLSLTAFLFSLTTHRSSAQSPYELASQELRYLFGNIANPNPSVSFFYDLSGHYVDSAFFDKNNTTDTMTTDLWYKLYEEMWWMAYDTNSIQNVQDVLATASQVANMGAPLALDIPIGVIDYNYNLLKPSALTTDSFFIFDTVNNVLYDKPGAPNPFTVQTTFSCAPLIQSCNFANPVFRIDPSLVFKDAYKPYNRTMTFKIDFDDGNGWQMFPVDGGISLTYQPNYATAGTKLLKFAVFDGTTLIRSSIASFFIGSTDVLPIPTETFTSPGINGSIYDPPGCTPNAEKKYVIVLEGMDLLGDRFGPQIYSDLIVDPQLVQLKNFGYSFIVVDWKNAHLPIQTNAMNVVKLIDSINCANGPTSPPLVVVGESMGGLISRYALMHMEKPGFSSVCRDQSYRKHNTRLLITLDAPHDGANVPLGVQYLYRFATTSAASLLSIAPSVLNRFQQYFTLLDGAASQMLKYHVSTDPLALAPYSNSPIFEHPNKTAFDNELASMGNYPKYCKLVATSNGSWLGGRQIRPWDGNYRQPNDHMLRADAETYIKILGVKVLGTKFKFDLRTNPDGNGNVFFIGTGVSHWKIKLKWFGLKVVWHTTYHTAFDKNVRNVKPYCVMPGSIGGATNITLPGHNPQGFNFNGLFGYSQSNGNGGVSFNAWLGSPIFGQTNFSYSAYSDGMDFGFIPTASSFDYDDGGAPLDEPIITNTTNVGNIMSNTRFDVVYTNPTLNNEVHPFINYNKQLEFCLTCTTNPGDLIHSYLLNREIGDDSLWLENTHAIYTGNIEAERDIMLNHRNYYYNYPSQYATVEKFKIPNLYYANMEAIVLSKENPYQLSVPGKLSSNNSLVVNTAQPVIGSYYWSQGNMILCCTKFTARAPGKNVPLEQIDVSRVSLYPNPSQGQATLQYAMKYKLPVTVTLYDATGRTIKQWRPQFENHTQTCSYPISFSDLQLSTGNYIIVISNGKEKYQAKLTINHK